MNGAASGIRDMPAALRSRMQRPASDTGTNSSNTH
jgi:hypothetical protein